MPQAKNESISGAFVLQAELIQLFNILFSWGLNWTSGLHVG